MTESRSGVELGEKLSLLAENFFQELKKIAEQRMKLEKESISAIKTDSSTKSSLGRKVKSSLPKTFTVRLETSLAEKLAKSRGTADELEDKLQETRLAFEDKLKTVERMKTELDRRENVLVHSIQQIEAYLRAVFYMKQESDNMHGELKNSSTEKDALLQKLKKDCGATRLKKESILKGINVFQTAKTHLEKKISDLPEFSTIRELVEYYLVLETLQEDLLVQEGERAQQILSGDHQRDEEYRRRFPTIVASKESELLKLESKLKNLKNENSHLEEQIDLTHFAKFEDDATWYDVQRWIKKMFSASVQIRTPGPEEATSSVLDMLERLKDFTRDALEITERLKEDA